MAVTLGQIWQVESKELERILATQKRTLSDNLNFDRALVALIYHNDGLLTDLWIAHPNFIQVMSNASTLEEGLAQLKLPYKRMIVQLFVATDTLYNYLSATTILLNGSPIDDFLSILDNMRLKFDNDGLVLNLTREELDEYEDPDQPQPDTFYDAITKIRYNTWDNQFDDVIQLIITNDKLLQQTSDKYTGGKVFDDTTLIKSLLKVDLSSLNERIRCYYIYLFWELLQTIPPNPELDKLLANKGPCVFSDALANRNVTVEHLTPILTGLWGDTRNALVKLIKNYMTTTRDEVMAALSDL